MLSNPTLFEWFNPACFSQLAPGQLGNTNRTPLFGPRFVNSDFSVIKHFVPREGMRVGFRAEFFNLFNHAQFGAPGLKGYGADFASASTFAVINYTVNNPRLVQFALKLAFYAVESRDGVSGEQVGINPVSAPAHQTGRLISIRR